MVILDYQRVDSFVTAEQKAGANVRWDGWTMVYFTPNKHAGRSPKGRYVKGRWGFETRIPCDHNGKWKVPNKFARTSRPSGH